AESAEDLLEQQIGWRLPVENLLWWVRGLPAPDSPSRLQLNPDSRLARLAQAGWTVEYSRYQEVEGVQLPQRLQLSGHDMPPTMNRATLSLPAPAKLNLFLHITGRRADGYHLLQTLFQFLDHGDTLHFTPREDGQIRLLTELPGVAAEDNLILRAARRLQQVS